MGARRWVVGIVVGSAVLAVLPLISCDSDDGPGTTTGSGATSTGTGTGTGVGGSAGNGGTGGSGATGGAPEGCNNGQTDPGEACDGADLNGHDCTTVAAGFVSGTLACNANCSGYDVSACVPGGTVCAASCSQQDVQAAIDQAQDGDTVFVPAGQCTWQTHTDNEPAVSITDKAIVLRGAGIDQTIIIDETSTGTSGHYSEDLLGIHGVEGKPFRVTDFSMRRLLPDEPTDTMLIAVSGTNKSWRVDHNHFFIEQGDAAVFASGYTYGLVDNNTLDGYGRVLVMGDADAAWKRPLELGTAKAVYIETNVYDCDSGNAVDSNNGARYVFRHNEVSDSYVMAHGSQWGRGTFSYEVYGNSFVDGPSSWAPISQRGGTGVIYDNVCTGFLYGAGRINVYYDRSCDAAQLDCACDGTCHLDGNEDATGYPCLDQIGRSTDASETEIHPQAIEPLYEWNNTNDGENVDIVLHSSCEHNADHMQEGRDYFTDTERPGYLPYVYPHPLAEIDGGAAGTCN